MAKAIWTTMAGGIKPRTKPEKKRSKRVRCVSKSQTKKYQVYRRERDKFLADHPTCQAPGCGKGPTELHHKRGRRHLLLVTEYWVALCHHHHEMCTSSPLQARALGIVCDRGEWGESE